jgi:hypothetical protein
MVAAGLLVAGTLVVLVAVLALRAWVMVHRQKGRVAHRGAGARECTPLTSAILASDRRERKA